MKAAYLLWFMDKGIRPWEIGLLTIWQLYALCDYFDEQPRGDHG